MRLITKVIADIASLSGIDHDIDFVTEIINSCQEKVTAMSDAQLEETLAILANKLEEPACATYWTSDYHGREKEYSQLLYRRFGFIRLKITEKLPSESDDPGKTLYSKEEQDVIAYVIRTGKLPQKNTAVISNKKTINGLAEILRSRALSLQKTDYVRNKAPKELNQNIMNLFYRVLSAPEENRIINNPLIFNQYIQALSTLCRELILGDESKQIYLGDAFDRGDDPDKLIKLFIEYKNFIKFVWGNHEFPWMAAATGHRAMVAEALRISFRYDQTKFINRMGINFNKLETFVQKTYIDRDRETGRTIDFNVKAKIEKNQYIEKSLFVILTKLEHAAIKRNPQFNMADRLYLDRLAEAIKGNKTQIAAYNDEGKLENFDLVGLNFPTIDPNNPEKLTPEEEEIINDLSEQFRTSAEVKKIIGYLYEKGHAYYRHYSKLGVHSGIPCTKDGQLKELPVFDNKKGRALFDHIEKMIKETGKNYLADEKIAEEDIDYQYFLWCGVNSPFFDKHKMATWERYIIVGGEKSSAGKENSLYWLKNMEKPEFRKMIFEEFSDQDETIESFIQGHTPQNHQNHQEIYRHDGEHIIIDSSIIKKDVGSIYAETSRKKYLIHPNLSYEELLALDEEASMDVIIPVEKDLPKQRKFKDIKESKKSKVLYAMCVKEQENRTRQEKEKSAEPDKDSN